MGDNADAVICSVALLGMAPWYALIARSEVADDSGTDDDSSRAHHARCRILAGIMYGVCVVAGLGGLLSRWLWPSLGALAIGVSHFLLVTSGRNGHKGRTSSLDGLAVVWFLIGYFLLTGIREEYTSIQSDGNVLLTIQSWWGIQTADHTLLRDSGGKWFYVVNGKHVQWTPPNYDRQDAD